LPLVVRDPAAIAFLIVLLLVLPALAIEGSRQLGDRPLPPRSTIFVQTLVIQLGLLAFALVVARRGGIPVWRVRTPDAVDLLVTLAALALALGTLPLRWRTSSPWRRARLLALVPHTRAEHALWIVVSAAAGIAEEVVYRGVLFALLASLLGGWWLPAVVGALAFGAAHALQGWRSGALVAVFGLAFQLLVRLTGTLYLAMAAHFLYDLVAGPVIARMGRREWE
jgi:membrane protease YdiL (CAAX protease family)